MLYQEHPGSEFPVPSESVSDVLTAKEAVALLRISPPTLYELVKRGQVPARRVGRNYRFSRAALLDWLTGKGCVSHSRR